MIAASIATKTAVVLGAFAFVAVVFALCCMAFAHYLQDKFPEPEDE